MLSNEDYFSEDYMQARALFSRLARMADVRLHGYEIPEKGPGGETLHTDIAWVGSPTAKKLLLVQSGVHGVEAFAGSAIQCNLLDHVPPNLDKFALVLVHVVNPWGMAWLRRVNSSNVDLNRNCLYPWEEYSGAPAGYALLDGLINPASPPRKDLFALKTAYRVMRQGGAAVRRAAAQGQYEYPAGLFYGGARLQREPALLRQWLKDHITGIDRLTVLDLHTGLGRFGEHLVIPAFAMDEKVRLITEMRFGCSLDTGDNGGDGYPVTGSVSALYETLFEDIDLQYFTVEFGTLPPLKVLRALRDENRHHFYSGGNLDHWSKEALKRALYPASSAWKERVLEDGRNLVENALWCLGRDFGNA